jgi:hypothetical protein
MEIVDNHRSAAQHRSPGPQLLYQERTWLSIDVDPNHPDKIPEPGKSSGTHLQMILS